MTIAVENLGTIQDAATRYRVSTKTVRRWISQGEIKAFRIGPKLVRVDLESVNSRPIGSAA